MNQINSKYNLTGFAETNIGGKSINQDCVGYLDTPSGFLVVICDGFGEDNLGHATAVTTIQTIINHINTQPKNYDGKALLNEAINAADATITRYKAGNPKFEGVGASVVCGLVTERGTIVATVGSCGFYHVRNGEIIQKSIANDFSHIGSNATPDFFSIKYKKGDKFVLCSDGLGNTNPEVVVAKNNSMVSLQEYTQELVDYAVEEGIASGEEYDNITVATLEMTQSGVKNTGRKIFGFIILLALLALLAYGGYYVYQNYISIPTPEPKAEQKQAPADTTNVDTTKVAPTTATDSLGNPVAPTTSSIPGVKTGSFHVGSAGSRSYGHNSTNNHVGSAYVPHYGSSAVDLNGDNTTADAETSPSATTPTQEEAPAAEAPKPAEPEHPFKAEIGQISTYISDINSSKSAVEDYKIKRLVMDVRKKNGPQEAVNKLQEAAKAKGPTGASPQSAALKNAKAILEKAKEQPKEND